ncbi:MAG: NfeD family protein [Lachnospiraceae bacterium]|nr:NfeD family protein [Lachnospiraceae bacterium]
MADLNMTVFWLVVLVVLVIIELLTMGLTTVWFAGGALVATIAALFHAPLALQVIIFLIVSAVLLFFTRPLAVKYFNKDRVRTNAESLVGHQAIVISEIDNLQGIGQVNVGGMEWSARTRMDGMRLPVGTVTTVLGINGVKLIVEERKEV